MIANPHAPTHANVRVHLIDTRANALLAFGPRCMHPVLPSSFTHSERRGDVRDSSPLCLIAVGRRAIF